MKKLILVCFIGLLPVVHSLQAQDSPIDLAKGLKAYYTFTNQSLNSMVPSQGAQLKGAQWMANRFGSEVSAFDFNGVDQNLLIPYHDGLDIDKRDGYSISLWLKPRDSNQGCILLKEGDYGLKWNGMRDPLTVFDGLNNGFPMAKFDDWESARWYHIALIKQASTLYLYIDGRLDASWPLQGPKKSLDKNLYIGKHPYFWGAFKGGIDDIALYDRPLNSYEVSVLSQIENIPLESFANEPIEKADLNDFLGTWEGVITQEGNKEIPNYSFTLHFTKIEDGILKGYSRIEVPENDAFGVTRIQGIVSGNALSFEEIQIYRQKNYNGYKWCQKYGQIIHESKNDNVKGKWYANNCQMTGELLLFKTKNKFNYYDNRLSRQISLSDLEKMLEGKKQGKVASTSSTKPILAANKEVAKAPPVQTVSQKEDTYLKVDLDPIEFSFNNSNLTPSSMNYLKGKLVPLLKQYPSIKLKIEGYTDASGDDDYNMTLSYLRAKTIYQFLVSQGVGASRLSYQGFGEANPLSNNTTITGRKQNRRVEFKVDI
ncbi:MAG: OmpA family protein [Bacteroidota bacterium]